MEQVHQETIIIQPIIIASRHHPHLMEMNDDNDDENNEMENQNASGPNVQINFQNLEYG